MKFPALLHPALYLLMLTFSPLAAGDYYLLCEGNFGQANASLWKVNEALTSVEGPIHWNTSSNPLGDIGQSMTRYEHSLFLVMNNSHQIKVLHLDQSPQSDSSIDLPGASPRYMGIHPASGTAYISSWGYSALLVMDLESYAVTDTIPTAALPEHILVNGDQMFVSITMYSDWSDEFNQIYHYDLSGGAAQLINTYSVVAGPGSMVLDGNKLYITSIYYNDAWETFSGSSVIDLSDHTVRTIDHGAYSNYSADINLINGTPYRTFGNAVVAMTEDLSLDFDRGLGDVSNIYSFSFANDRIILGSSDFVAPDEIHFYDALGLELGSFNVGALPGDCVYYDPDLVSVDPQRQYPEASVLLGSYPNPFNPSTTLGFELVQTEEISLEVFDIRGRLIKTLLSGHTRMGQHHVVWDGSNQHGKDVASGIYLAVLRGSTSLSALKLELIR